jgi:hypothetical protein
VRRNDASESLTKQRESSPKRADFKGRSLSRTAFDIGFLSLALEGNRVFDMLENDA